MTRQGSSIGGCFVCGKDNPDGLQLDFMIDHEARELESRWTPEARFQGYPELLHGGILATLLDEAVAKLCYEVGLAAVTAEMNIRFRKPVNMEQPVTIRGRIVQERGRVLMGRSEVVRSDGEIAASAEVKLVKERR